MQAKDWAIIGGYVLSILTALSSQAAPGLIDQILGVFGVPPGLGPKIALVAGSVLGLITIVSSHVNSVKSINAAAQSGPTPPTTGATS